MTTGTVQVIPVILGSRFWLELGGLLVTIGAGDRNVSASQDKVGFLVLRDREG